MNALLKWTPRLGLLLALASVIMLFLAGFGYKQQWWGLGTSFSMMRILVYVAGAGLLLGLISLLSGLKLGWGRAFTGLLIIAMAAGAAAVPLTMRSTARSVPPIHDITTDTQDPPRFVAVLPLRAEAPNPPEYLGGEVTSQQLAAYPDLTTLTLSHPIKTVHVAAMEVVEDMGWELVDSAPNDGRIEATHTTPWFGFKDDVVIRMQASGSDTLLDIRSKSRVGGSDLGLNAKRIRAFREKLLSRLQTPG